MIREQPVLCHPSDVAENNVHLYRALKTTLQDPRVCHYSPKMLQREAGAQHAAAKSRARATDTQPYLPAAPQGRRQSQQEYQEHLAYKSRQSQQHLAYKPLSASQHILVRIPMHFNNGCKSSSAPNAQQPQPKSWCCSYSTPKVAIKTNIMAISKRAGSPEKLRSPVFPLPCRQKQLFLSSS